MTLQADLTLVGSGVHRIKARHIALLEAVGRTGSIAGAARQVGFSYKTAWDGLAAIQHLARQPLLQKTSGGRGGGGAELTPAGLRLIDIWHHLQSSVDSLTRQAQKEIDFLSEATMNLEDDVSNKSVLTSARNVLSGEVAGITPLSQQQGQTQFLLADVCLDLGGGQFIHSFITRKSVERLGLRQQCPVHALVKASFVEIIPGTNPSSPTDKNRLCGTICEFSSDEQHSEITVNLGIHKTITATMLKNHYAKMCLKPGLAATAQFSPADVILAIT